MSLAPPPRQEWNIDVGSRIRIRQGRRPIADLVGHEGMVVEVFRLPLDSCMVRIDGDLDQREWFFYGDEIALAEA